MAILGYQLSLAEKWSLGVSTRLPSLHIAGSATYFDKTLNSGTTLSTNNLTNLSTRNHRPAKYNLGIAYEEPGSILVAADVSTYSR